MRSDMDTAYNRTDIGLSLLFQYLLTNSSDVPDSNVSLYSNHSLGGAIVRDLANDVTPFWQRSSTIWLTVTLSLFLLTGLAGSINIYIWFLQNKKHQQDTFVSFLSRSRSSAKHESKSRSDTPKPGGKFRVMKI